MRNRLWMVLAGCLVLALSACSGNGAQGGSEKGGQIAESDYPDGDLRIQVPFKTGGALDVQVRTTAKYLSKELGVNVIIENTAGAGGQLGTTEYLKEPANTSTILLTDAWLMTVIPMTNQVEYAVDDYMPIIDHNVTDFCLYACPSKSGIDSFEALKAYGQENRVLFGSGGGGTSLYIVQKSLLDAMGIPSDTISQNSTSEGMANLMAGTVDVSISSFKDAADYVTNGDVVPILWFGEGTYQDEGAYAAGVPAARDLGVEVEYQGFYYYSIRKETSQDIIDKLQTAIARVYENTEFQEECEKIGFAPRGMNPEEINSYLEDFTNMAKENFSLN